MGDVPSRGDWVVGGSGCNSGGTPVSANTWGGFPAPVANTTFTWQSVTIQPLGLGVNAPPTVGEVLVDLIQGNICFLSAGAPSVVQVGVGIYVSKFTQLSSVWQLRDPLNPTDANSDDYLYLRSMVVLLPSNTAQTCVTAGEFPLGISRPIIIGGGEALNITISAATISGDTAGIVAYPNFRARLRWVD